VVGVGTGAGGVDAPRGGAFAGAVEKARVARAAEDARRGQDAREREALRAERLDGGVGQRDVGGADLGGHILVPVRARRLQDGDLRLRRIGHERGLDEARDKRLAAHIEHAVAGGRHHIGADRLDHPVPDEDRRLLDRLARGHEDLGADERVARGVAWPHPVDGRLLRVRESGEGERKQRRVAGKMHVRNRTGIRRFARFTHDRPTKSPASAKRQGLGSFDRPALGSLTCVRLAS